MSEEVQIQSKCNECAFRKKAEEKPKSFLAWLWRFHTKFCPGWRAYMKELDSLGIERPKV
jgi:hypothetical protein